MCSARVVVFISGDRWALAAMLLRALHSSTKPWALLLSMLAITACAGPRTRPVVDVAPRITSVEVIPAADVDALAFSVHEQPVDQPTVEFVFEAAVEEMTRELGQRLAGGVLEGLIGNDGPMQLDPDQGPVDLGLAVHVNLGAGEAPFDDAMHTIHPDGPGRTGFSDSVLQFSWRERMGETFGLHGTAALSRYQDLTIIDSLEDAELAWVVVGVHAAF